MGTVLYRVDYFNLQYTDVVERELESSFTKCRCLLRRRRPATKGHCTPYKRFFTTPIFVCLRVIFQGVFFKVCIYSRFRWICVCVCV